MGDLDYRVEAVDLVRVLHGHFVAVKSVHVLKHCIEEERSLQYAYVNFYSEQDAVRAMGAVNHTNLYGRALRVMRCERDPSRRISGVGNLFVGRLSPTMGNRELYDMFARFGSITSCKVATYGENGASKGYGFVHFDDPTNADRAINEMDGFRWGQAEGQLLHVTHFRPKQRQSQGVVNDDEEAPMTVYARKFGDRIGSDDITRIFAEFGAVEKVLMREHEIGGIMRRSALIMMRRKADAMRAIATLHNTKLHPDDEDMIYVARARSKRERMVDEQRGTSEPLESTTRGRNLFVSNLPSDVTTQQLGTVFGRFGTVTSVKVRSGNDERSPKKFGFVCFATEEDAREAMNRMHGARLSDEEEEDDPISVQMYRSKREREAEKAERDQKMRLRDFYNKTNNSDAAPPVYNPNRDIGYMVYVNPIGDRVEIGEANSSDDPSPTGESDSARISPNAGCIKTGNAQQKEIAEQQLNADGKSEPQESKDKQEEEEEKKDLSEFEKAIQRLVITEEEVRELERKLLPDEDIPTRDGC